MSVFERSSNGMKNIIIGLVGILISIGLFSAPALVSAGPFDSARNQACQGIEFDVNSTGDCSEAGAGEKLDSTLSAVINIASLVVGVVSVIMVIIGGLKYVSSQGDSNGTASAKNTVIYAIVGLVIVALSQIMVRFVINRATDTNQTTPSSQTVNEPDRICPRGGDICLE